MKVVYLDDLYYQTYTVNKYPQLELKPNRPYIPITLDDGSEWAVPLRSNLTHPHVFYTNRRAKCGLDYSKAVPLEEKYVRTDITRDIYIRQEEFDKLKGKLWRIKNGLQHYIEIYKAAKADLEYEHRDDILAFSALQYFEDKIDF